MSSGQRLRQLPESVCEITRHETERKYPGEMSLLVMHKTNDLNCNTQKKSIAYPYHLFSKKHCFIRRYNINSKRYYFLAKVKRINTTFEEVFLPEIDS
ncbi:MAG: hypothetical protein H7258_11295 [Ferruginibacter sp.]|nr:hypothetical protein [Ferruginibacter sp.]